MDKDALFENYPWYRQHQRAVDTIATCLAVDVEHVLLQLDKKINSKNCATKVEIPVAA